MEGSESLVVGTKNGRIFINQSLFVLVRLAEYPPGPCFVEVAQNYSNVLLLQFFQRCGHLGGEALRLHHFHAIAIEIGHQSIVCLCTNKMWKLY